MTHSPQTASPRPAPAEELKAVAIEQFARVGFAGTSLQQIAEKAGYSKSSVLYHFASKEALLEAALVPAIERLEAVIAGVGRLRGSEQDRRDFIADFIDFLFDYRYEVHIFINQGQALQGVAVLDRANATIHALAESCSDDLDSVEDAVRFGIALGGSAYSLVASMTFGDELPAGEMREAMIDVVGTLLAPVASSTREG